MSKNEFLNQLSQLLADISPEEREEALTYYREYIDDAGLENEDAVIGELGSPAEVAAEIKAGLFNKGTQRANALQPRTSETSSYSDGTGQFHQQAQSQQANQDTDTVILVVALIALVLLSPVWIPAVVSVFAALFGLLVGSLVGGIACIIAGFALTIVGIIKLIALSPLVGFSLIGAGFLVLAIGILFLLFGIWLCATAIPWCINGISHLFQRLVHHKKEAHV